MQELKELKLKLAKKERELREVKNDMQAEATKKQSSASE